MYLIVIVLNNNITNTYTMNIAVQFREIIQTQGDEIIESITMTRNVRLNPRLSPEL